MVEINHPAMGEAPCHDGNRRVQAKSPASPVTVDEKSPRVMPKWASPGSRPTVKTPVFLEPPQKKSRTIWFN